jgi:hypothetical protein
VYQPRTPGFTKRDPVKRWAVPDRVFFACGSCHILAHAFLERYGAAEHDVTWIKPAIGYWGNHVFVSSADWVFDFHGYSRREAFLAHVWKRSRALWPGWDATLVAFRVSCWSVRRNRAPSACGWPNPDSSCTIPFRARDGIWIAFLRRPGM